MTTAFLRTVILYFILMIGLRLMGKRQIGELEPSELVLTLIISDLAAVPMQDFGIPLVNGLFPIATLLCLSMLLSFFSLKSVRFRALVCGRPTVIIREGKVLQQNMARNRFTPGTGSELQGKTLAIHAYGNVGRLVGIKGKALGMNVIAFDPFITDAAVFERDGVKKVDSVAELYAAADYLSLHIPATEQTRKSIGYDLAMSMPKGATIVNTARKEVIDEDGLTRAMSEREDLKYVTDIAPEAAEQFAEKFGKRFFATPKKQGAETAEANINAGLAAARQIADFFATGNVRFQVNK